jgi:hypothetical protein
MALIAKNFLVCVNAAAIESDLPRECVVISQTTQTAARAIGSPVNGNK